MPSRRQIYRRRRIVVFGGLLLVAGCRVLPADDAARAAAAPRDADRRRARRAAGRRRRPRPSPATAPRAIGARRLPRRAGQRRRRPTPLPMASITKIVTALTVLEAHPLGVDEAGPTVTMTAADVALLRRLPAGERQGRAGAAPARSTPQRELLDLAADRVGEQLLDDARGVGVRLGGGVRRRRARLGGRARPAEPGDRRLDGARPAATSRPRATWSSSAGSPSPTRSCRRSSAPRRVTIHDVGAGRELQRAARHQRRHRHQDRHPRRPSAPTCCSRPTTPSAPRRSRSSGSCSGGTDHPTHRRRRSRPCWRRCRPGSTRSTSATSARTSAATTTAWGQTRRGGGGRRGRAARPGATPRSRSTSTADPVRLGEAGADGRRRSTFTAGRAAPSPCRWCCRSRSPIPVPGGG